MRDLCEGVDARIGPAGADHSQLSSRQRSESVENLPLERRRAALDLPAVVRRAVIGQQQREPG